MATSDIPFLIHLNGIAGYDYSPRNLAEKANAVYKFEENEKPLISFAWEDESNTEMETFITNRKKYMKQIASNTDILIVIGYSFPFFNRKIDDEIFKSAGDRLSKIYFQDPFNDGKNLIGQFTLSEMAKNNIIHIPQTANYHIPYEF